MHAADRLIQGMAGDGHFRVIAAQTTIATEMAREILDLAPVAADALGRAMTGALLLARLLNKGLSQQYVSLRFEGSGPLGTVIAEGTVEGNVRGYVANPVPEDPLLTVEAAVGSGRLSVVRGTPPVGKPYSSQILLSGSGIATDLTRYLMRSEQIASAVLLGVLNRREGVAAAGGIVIQAFPGTSNELIRAVEQRIQEAPALSTLLEKLSIDETVATVFDGFGYKQIDLGEPLPVRYACSCTADRALAPLALLERSEIEEMISEGGTEVTCQFCGRRYRFSPEDLMPLTARHDA